jgi:hypothetical protein
MIGTRQPGARSLIAPLVLALVVCAGLSRAQSNDARALADRGLESFRHGAYEPAAQDFMASYAINPIAELLFNAAQAYRLGGDCPQALAHYQQYVDIAPQGRLRAQAEAMIAKLQSCGAPADPSPQHEETPGSAIATAPTPTTTTPTPAIATTPNRPATRSAKREKPPIYKRWWVWSTVAVVVAGAGVGLGFGLTYRPAAPSAPAQDGPIHLFALSY